MTTHAGAAAAPFRFDVVTLFEELVRPYLEGSILGRALRDGRIEVGFTNPRDFTTDKHRSVDDTPYGGGAGMVMSVEPLARAVEALREERRPARVVLLSPGGRRFTQDIAAEYAAAGSVAFVCGRYEGVDDRVAQAVVDEELSVGDYVLTGGELGAMVVIDAVSRLVPGVLGNAQGAVEESFTGAALLEHPQFTRPRVWRDLAVPDVLLSGDHGRIADWRHAQRIARTRQRRPDLYQTWLVDEATDRTGGE